MVTKQKKILLGGVAGILALGLFVSWFVHAPTSALSSIKSAAERRDIGELNQLIDFPSLKSSLKVIAMDTIAPQSGTKGARAGMVRLFAGALIGPMVEAMVTPESIAGMCRGRLERKPGRQSTEDSQTPDEAQQTVTMTKEWDSLSTVRVKVRSTSSPGQGLTFVMHREGLAWRLTALEQMY